MCIDVYIDKVLVYTSCESENTTNQSAFIGNVSLGYNISNSTKVLNTSIFIPSPTPGDILNDVLSPSIAPAVHTITTPSISMVNISLMNATPSSQNPISPTYIDTENKPFPVLLITISIMSAVLCLIIGVCCCKRSGKIHPRMRQLTHLRCCSTPNDKSMLPMKASETLTERVRQVGEKMRETPMSTASENTKVPKVPKRPQMKGPIKPKIYNAMTSVKEKPPPVPKRAAPPVPRALPRALPSARAPPVPREVATDTEKCDTVPKR